MFVYGMENFPWVTEFHTVGWQWHTPRECAHSTTLVVLCFTKPAVFVTARFPQNKKNNGSFLHSDRTVNTVKNSVNISQIQYIISRRDFEKALMFLQSL